MSIIRQTLNVGFGESGGSGLSGQDIQLQHHGGITPVGVFYLRLYPSVPAKVRASRGQVTKQGTVVLPITGESVTFRGSNTASTRFPIVSTLTVSQVGMLFDRDGNPVGGGHTLGGGTGISFSFRNGQLVCNKPEVYGNILVDYTTTYELLKYDAVLLEGAILTGTVMAFYNRSVATLDVSPPEDEDNYTELYRVVSNSIVQEQDAYEKPEDFPSQTFPEEVPDPDEPYIEMQRVHEIGYITKQGSVFDRKLFVPLELPKVGTAFVPQKELRVADASTGDLTQSQLNSAVVQAALQSAKNRHGLT